MAIKGKEPEKSGIGRAACRLYKILAATGIAVIAPGERLQSRVSGRVC
jgi:hypothetical protein